MHKVAIATLVLASFALAQDPPAMPKPVKEHEWLQQWVGEWEGEAEMMSAPDQPPTKNKGTESARSLGGFWILSEVKADMMGMPFTGVMTVGYDPEKKKYVGTWVDSMGSHLWKYEGSVDKDGKTLILETEGPNPQAPGKTAKYRETMEFKDKDHKVFTSSMLGEDGKWVTFLTVKYTRKK
jgi:hypothetical protein